MGVRALAVLALVGVVFLLTGPASGAVIYVTASEKSGESQAVTEAVGILQGRGHTVTVGVKPSLLDGSVNLTGYDAVVLNIGCGSSVPDVPAAGEQMLVDFVNNDGRLVTAEYLIRDAAVNPILDVILPGVSLGGLALIDQVYVLVMPDPVLNAGLAGNVVFKTTKQDGSGTTMEAKPGAMTYYTGSATGAGVVGWQVPGGGNVVSFNVIMGKKTFTESGNEDFKTLFGNAVDRSLGAPIPEPGTLALLVFAGAGILLKRKR